MTDQPDREDAAPDAEIEDEALSWAGDEERGGFAPRASAEHARPDGVEPGSASASSSGGDGEASGAPRSAARTLATLVFGAVYLAIVLGWVLSVQRTASGSADLFVEITWQFGEFLAMISGVLWFAAVLTLTRASATFVRVAWWALGALVLVPWPLVLVLIAEASA